jgi:hypothetical protein
MEHRCGFRRIVNVAVMVRTRGGLAGKGVLCEVSASGARLVSSLPLPLQSAVLVQFDLCPAGGRRRRATLEAEVVRPTQTGYGLEWTEFAPETARALYGPPVRSSARAEAQPEQRRVRRK